MANERKTDFFIGKLLDGANIDYTPNGSSIKEIKDALKTSSKKKRGKQASLSSYVSRKILLLSLKIRPI